MNNVSQKSILYYLLNKNFESFLIVFLSIFTFYIIFEHLFELTKFVINYNSTYDYGKLIKQSCNDEFVEYETSRFHMSNNMNDLKIPNTVNKGRYNVFILVITIIIGLYISLVFSFTLRNALYNQNWFDNLNESFESKLDENANVLQKIGTYVFKIFSKIFGVMDIYNFVKKFLIENKHGYPYYKSLILLFILILINLVIIASLVIMPIYIGLQLNNNINISLFSKDPRTFVPYVVGITLIVLLRLAYFVFAYDEFYIVDIDPIKEYFSTNVNEIFTSNTIFGYMSFFAIFGIYIFMFWVIGNIIFQYNNWKNNNDDKDIKPSSFDVTTEYLNNIFGIYELNKIKDDFYYDKLSAVTLIMIIITVAMILFYITSKQNSNIKNLMKYGIISPLIFLISIYIITQVNTNFNDSVNQYIIKNTDSLYKQYIDVLNRTFNKILMTEQDSSNSKKTIDYVCKNVGNAILLTLYNNLFKNIENITRTGDDTTDEYIDITPEFQYDKSCDTNHFFEFSKNDEYDISYYLNGKTYNKSIFFNVAKCSNINQKVLDTIAINLQIFTKSEFKTLKSQIAKEIFENQLSKKEDPILYIKYKIIENNDDYLSSLLDFKAKIKKEMFFAINNILQYKVYNSTNTDQRQLIYYHGDKYFKNDGLVEKSNIVEVDLSLFEIFNENNKLYNKFEDIITNTHITEYNDIVNLIVDKYLHVIYLYLYTTVKYPNIDSNDEQKNEFIEFLSVGIKKVFDGINKDMENLIQSYSKTPITRYIITNHNNVNVNEVFRKNKFQIIEETLPEASVDFIKQSNNIRNIKQYLEHLSNYYSSISKLISSISTNEYSQSSVKSLIITTKLNVNVLNDLLLKEQNNDQMKNDVNSIIQEQSNYIIEYTINDKVYTIEKTIFSVLTNMAKVCQMLLKYIEEKYHIIANNKEDDLKEINENIDICVNILNANINMMKNDFLNFENKIADYAKPITKTSNLSMESSNKIYSNSKKTDKMVYLLCFNYLIPIILTNFIYYL